MILLISLILAISFVDLRPMLVKGQKKEVICFIAIALVSILYGYYYMGHIYTASVIGFFLDLLNIQ